MDENDIPEDPSDPGPATDEHGLPHWTEPGTSQIQMVGDDDLDVWSGLGQNRPSGDIPQISIESDPSAERQFFGYEEEAPAGAAPTPPTAPQEPRRVSSRPQARQEPQPEQGGGRRRSAGGGALASNDLMMRVLTAVGMAAVALIALAAGREVTLALVTVLLVVSASEFFVSLRKVGYQPATLLGLAAVAALPIGTFWRGEAAIALGMFLFMVFGTLWYLLGVEHERPVPNLGVSALAVVWIGVLGSYAALLLDFVDLNTAEEHGVGLLLAAILMTVAHDIGAYFVGRSAGRSPLTDYSPNKSVEGLIGGMVATVVVSVAIAALGLSPFDGDPFGTVDALIVGIAVSIVAPLGDLTESIFKRDLGVKDMGAVLPGHGGLLDRFDSMLFVFPTVYYMVQVLQ